MTGAEFTFTDEDPDEVAEGYRSAEVATEGLRAAIKANRIKTDLDADMRVFVCPTDPNTRFLAVPGSPVSFRDPNSPTGERTVRRDNDVWVQFSSGICATRNTFEIEWCEAHSGNEDDHKSYHDQMRASIPEYPSARECEVPVSLCRDADWAGTPAWAEMKSAQQSTSRRTAALSPNMDVDRLFARVPPDARVSGEVGQRLENAAEAARSADRERTRGR